MKGRRLHPLFCQPYLKLLVLPCILPVVRAVAARDAGLAQSLLWEDGYFLAAVLAYIFLLWRTTNYTRTPTALTLRRGLLFRRRTVVPLSRATALVTQASPLYRLTGGVRCTLYFEARGPGVTFSVGRGEAAALAEALFPARDAALFYKPQGKGVLGYALLSTDALAAGLVTGYSLYKLYGYLDAGLRQLAREQFMGLEAALELFFPAGVALAAALVLLTACFLLFGSLSRTLGFQVLATPRVLLSRGGFFTRREVRVRRDAISCAFVRVTPLARLTRHCPLYVAAGGFGGRDMPFFLYSRGDEARVRTLLPAFRDPFSGPWCNPRQKPPLRYLALPAALTGVGGAALSLCLTRAPALAPLCLGPIAVGLVFFALSVEGIFREGVQNPAGGALAISSCRFFSREVTQFYTPACLARLSAASTGEAAGRVTLRVTAGNRRPARARAIPTDAALSVLERFGGLGVPFG